MKIGLFINKCVHPLVLFPVLQYFKEQNNSELSNFDILV